MEAYEFDAVDPSTAYMFLFKGSDSYFYNKNLLVHLMDKFFENFEKIWSNIHLYSKEDIVDGVEYFDIRNYLLLSHKYKYIY